LAAKEFVIVDEYGGYALGVRSFEVGAAYLHAMTPVRAVEHALQGLTAAFGVTSHFAVLENDEVIYLAKHDPTGPGLKLASSLGARLPARTTAVGKAQLAFLATSADFADAELASELDVVRSRGYAVDDGETAAGIRCVAAPVFDSRGCCGAVGVSYLLEERTVAEAMAEAVTSAAERTSNRLGGSRSAERPRGPMQTGSELEVTHKCQRP